MVGLPIYGIFLIVLIVFFLYNAIKILNEYERGVIFRLGRVLEQAQGSGADYSDTDRRQDGADQPEDRRA